MGLRPYSISKKQSPDIIFMDVMMPVMDGYEPLPKSNAWQVTNSSPLSSSQPCLMKRPLPVVSRLAAMTFSPNRTVSQVLSAKVKAMERIRTLHQDTRMLYSRMQRDEEIAEQVFTRAVIAGNVALEHIRSLLKPASVFSGDLMLTAFAPSHDLHVLLGDFTGHGLAQRWVHCQPPKHFAP